MSLPPLVEPAAELTVDEVRRYSRHLIIPDVGMDGQKRLKNAKVLCVGAGGLGSPALMYLAAAGVGTLGIVEFDEVDESNLQRQIIHSQADIGRSKAESAKDTVLGINPYVEVDPARGAARLLERDGDLRQYDLIVDGTDNFATRYLVNDACVLLNKPYVWGSIYRFDGQASVFWSEHGPCYRCLYPEPPPPGMVPSCAEGGVLGVLCASIGSIQVNEAIKLLAGIGDPLVGRLMIYDALEMSYRQVKVRKDPDCAVCGENPTVTELIDYEAFCGVVSDEAQEAAAGSTITPKQLKEWIDDGENIEIIDVREPNEYEIVSIPGARADPQGRVPDGHRAAGPAAGQEDRPALQDGCPVRGSARGAEERRLRRRRARRRRRHRLGQPDRAGQAGLLTALSNSVRRGLACADGVARPRSCTEPRGPGGAPPQSSPLRVSWVKDSQPGSTGSHSVISRNSSTRRASRSPSAPRR